MFLLFFILLLIVLYFYCTKNHDYWAKRNVKHEPPIPVFGNHFRNVIGQKSITEISLELYQKYPNEKVIGYYRGCTPELIVKDPQIIRRILNIDFTSFYQRGVGRNKEKEPLSANLFSTDDDTWKLLRQGITPAFTTAKLKGMFPLVVRCAEKLQGVCEEVAKRGGECDVRELMARFTTEFIGACGFGIEMDTINDNHSAFREMGKLIFSRSVRSLILKPIYELFPFLRKYIAVMGPELEHAITNIVQTIRDQRKGKTSRCNDFIDLLLEMESKGKLKGESMEKKDAKGKPVQVELKMDIKLMAAQVFVFFAAGFETSSSVTSFTLHKLAYNQDIQLKIQEEMDRVVLKYGNKLCYDAVAEMTLLDMAMKEAMRIFPSLGCLNRVCVTRYEIPELGIKLDPGVKILIPVQAIQNDEKYFENPTEFKPERFAPDAVKDWHNYAYLPFGEGPRACVGARLGQMQSLAGLAALLQKFTLVPGATTRPEPIVKHTSNDVQSVEGGLPLKLQLRQSHD